MRERSEFRDALHYEWKAFRIFLWTVGTVGLVCYLLYYQRMHVVQIIHTKPEIISVVSLPTNASDVNFRQQGSISSIYCDFQIDEESFVVWAKSFDCSFLPEVLERRDSSRSWLWQYDDGTSDWEHHPISDGFEFVWSHGDQGVILAFDRESKRGYVRITTY